MEKCYRCDAEATSVDHVPPRCVFPEVKDLPQGVNFRKNLITVPSCELHNTARSHDDEYLLCVLVTHSDNNDVARNHFQTKILRLLGKKPWFQATLLDQLTPVMLNGEQTAAYRVDVTRVKNVLESVAHGLYFNTYKESWVNSINIIPLGLFKLEGQEFVRHPLEQALLQLAQGLFETTEKLGENPDVFFYQIHRDMEKGHLVMRMFFYGGFEIVALSSPQDAEAVSETAVENTTARLSPPRLGCNGAFRGK